MTSIQISAHISEETKAQVETYSKKSGVKKGFLIEDALLHHLQALKEIPQDIIIPGNITLTDNCMMKLAGILENPLPPTTELQELMQND